MFLHLSAVSKEGPTLRTMLLVKSLTNFMDYKDTKLVLPKFRKVPSGNCLTLGMFDTISYSTPSEVMLEVCPILLLIRSVSEWRLYTLKQTLLRSTSSIGAGWDRRTTDFTIR